MCGIVGIFGPPRAAEHAALAMFAEQHRGQESCGMAVSDGKVIRLHRKMGLVKEVFNSDTLNHLPGYIAIGHVRYPTKGSATEFNSQPHLVETLYGPRYALASNGDIVNYRQIREEMEAEGMYFNSENDGELLVKYIVREMESRNQSIFDAIRKLMKEVKGAYSAVLATRDELYMFRDPLSIRPMVWGRRTDGCVVVASESCALDILDVEERWEVPPAGIIRIKAGPQSDNDLSSNVTITVIENDPNLYRQGNETRHCIFEHIYFSRPDSHHFGEKVFAVRELIGKALADEDPDLEADLVMPVPDSSNFIASGYAQAKGLPFSLGLIRNHYVGRTFIKPLQTIRDESVRQKFNLLPNFFAGKRIVLIDDSIVRGTTIRQIVKLIKKGGVEEIHLRVGSPQVRFPCYYGIDTPTKVELVANRLTLEEIRLRTGVDTLKHLSIPSLHQCVRQGSSYCYACFDGNYPIHHTNENGN